MVPMGIFGYVSSAATDDALHPRLLGAAEELAEKYGNPSSTPAKKRRRGLPPAPEEAFADYYGKPESQLGWLFIAKVWFEDWEKRDEALRCLGKAEELAVDMATISGWVEVAKVWAREIGDTGEAGRCLDEALMLPGDHSLKDCVLLAEGSVLLGKTESAREYLEKAESLANEPSDWETISLVWLKLGSPERADKAEEIAERLASGDSMDTPKYFRDSKGRYVSGDDRS